MKSSMEQTTPDEKGNIADEEVEIAKDNLSSDTKISAEEYIDSDPDQLGISSLGEGKMKITKRQLRRIIKEEKAKLLKEDRSMLSSEIYENVWTTLDDLALGIGYDMEDPETVMGVIGGLEKII